MMATLNKIYKMLVREADSDNWGAGDDPPGNILEQVDIPHPRGHDHSELNTGGGTAAISPATCRG